MNHPPENTQCDSCQAPLYCAVDKQNQTCWCTEFPTVLPVEVGKKCFCAACLGKKFDDYLARSVREDGLDAVLRLASEYSKDSRTQNLIEHVDYTLDGELYVFSKWFHLKRGTCCGSGCTNCPFPK